MSDYDSRPDTHEHIAQVRGLVLGVAEEARAVSLASIFGAPDAGGKQPPSETLEAARAKLHSAFTQPPVSKTGGSDG